jgi:hypothetical protein
LKVSIFFIGGTKQKKKGIPISLMWFGSAIWYLYKSFLWSLSNNSIKLNIEFFLFEDDFCCHIYFGFYDKNETISPTSIFLISKLI